LITPVFAFELDVFFFAGAFFIDFVIMSPAKMLIIFGCNEYPKKITSSITGQRSQDLQLQAV